MRSELFSPGKGGQDSPTTLLNDILRLHWRFESHALTPLGHIPVLCDSYIPRILIEAFLEGRPPPLPWEPSRGVGPSIPSQPRDLLGNCQRGMGSYQALLSDQICHPGKFSRGPSDRSFLVETSRGGGTSPLRSIQSRQAPKHGP